MYQGVPAVGGTNVAFETIGLPEAAVKKGRPQTFLQDFVSGAQGLLGGIPGLGGLFTSGAPAVTQTTPQAAAEAGGAAPVPPTSGTQQRRNLPGLGRAAFIGGMIPGVLAAGASGAESVRQKVTGEPTKGKEQEFSTQMAMRGQMLQQDLTSLERTLGVNLNATKDLAKFYSDQDLYNLQRMEPVLARMKNNEVVRQQALMNTQGQNYAMLGTLATAGQLATGAQAERGALMRTALTANPYASSTLQAPSISYG